MKQLLNWPISKVLETNFLIQASFQIKTWDPRLKLLLETKLHQWVICGKKAQLDKN